MQAATILGIPYLYMEMYNHYHLSLAHLLADKAYLGFFKSMSRRGDLLMMDNGVVETGLPMEWSLLKELAAEVEAQEVVLPDKIHDTMKTLEMGEKALRNWKEAEFDLIAVPQGETFVEWEQCLKEMLTWPIHTIGISRFVSKFVNTSRMDLFRLSETLLHCERDIHLLGCLNLTEDVAGIDRAFPGKVRGIDSGVAMMYSQMGVNLSTYTGTRKADQPIDFFTSETDTVLLCKNIEWWRTMCGK